MKTKKYKVVIVPGEDGYFVAECPSISGCVSQGKTKAEAVKNIKEAIELALECYEEDHKPLPRDTAEIRQVAIGS